MDNNITKEKYLSIITSFARLDATLLAMNILVEKLSQNFKKIYIINDENLKFFPKLSRKIEHQPEYLYKENYNFSEMVKNLPNNYVLFDPKSINEFSDFLSNKDLLVISNFARKFFDLKIHLLLKKHNIKQVQIDIIPNIKMSVKVQFKHFLKTTIYFLNQIIFQKITVLLSIIGVISKVEIKFTCKKIILDNIKKSFIKKFFYKNKFFFAKELILVNSGSYDILINNNNSTSEEFIVHLDASLNYRLETELRGKINEKRVTDHYYYLERILKKLSIEFNKKVLVCIHPLYNHSEHQKYFKDFDVLKFKTREKIYKSFLVTGFDSGMIADAILLKKKIIGFVSDFMSNNEINHSKFYAKKAGYLLLNTKKDYFFDKDKILRQMNQNLNNYEKYISTYHCFEPNKLGTNKIIKIIKEKFFNVETS